MINSDTKYLAESLYKQLSVRYPRLLAGVMVNDMDSRIVLANKIKHDVISLSGFLKKWNEFDPENFVQRILDDFYKLIGNKIKDRQAMIEILESSCKDKDYLAHINQFIPLAETVFKITHPSQPNWSEDYFANALIEKEVNYFLPKMVLSPSKEEYKYFYELLAMEFKKFREANPD